MHRHHGLEQLAGLAAIVVDALAIYSGIMLAVWVRFFSGWIPLLHDLPPMEMYWQGAGVATLIALLIMAVLGLYGRPRSGTFGDHVPRIVRAVFWAMGLTLILAFSIRTDPPFSRLTSAIAFITVTSALLLVRYLFFCFENKLARWQGPTERVTIIGTDHHAAALKGALENEPRLRLKVTSFLNCDDEQPDPSIAPELVRGSLQQLQDHLDSGAADHVILAQMKLDRARLLDVIVNCDRAMVRFHMVADLFEILASRLGVQHAGGFALLSVKKWPLEKLGNRLLKRAEDVVGATIGLALSAMLIIIFAILVKRSSPGPAFYHQERCGQSGKPFTIHKLRTMPIDAEACSGPVWARADDSRCTPLGAFMRRYGIDELPQFWNVLRGDMSLVGPRPERPHFVERFSEDIGNYMWRHVYKPGMTGWAQVNGWRGDTSLEERIKHDLFYLENWSLAFDFKILVRTFFARQNAH